MDDHRTGPTTIEELDRMEAAAHARDREALERLADDPAGLAAEMASRAACATRLLYTERRVHARACLLMTEILGHDVYAVCVGAKELGELVAELRQRTAVPAKPTTGLPLLDWVDPAA